MRHWNKRVILIMALAIALLAAGCGDSSNGNGNGSGSATANLSGTRDSLYGYMKQDLIESEVFSEADFDEEGNIPGYIITNLNRGEEGFDDYVSAIGLKPETTASILHIQPMMNTRAENILVFVTEDKADAESGLKLYHEGQDGIWSMYLPDQYELVKNNISGSKGDAVYYYITHEKGSDVEDVIRESVN